MKLISRLRTEHALLAGSLVLLFAVSFWTAQRPRSLGYDPQERFQGSSFYTTALGTKAFYTLLERVGQKPFRHERALDLLPGHTRELLILAPSHALETSEVDRLRDWVTRGGRLLVCPRRDPSCSLSDPVLAAFDLELCAASGPPRTQFEGTLSPLGLGKDRPFRLRATHGLRLRPLPRSGSSSPLAQDGRGWIAGVLTRGAGQVVALADLDLLDNSGVSRDQNVEFAAQLVAALSGGEPIAFDEFHHGFRTGQHALSILWDSALRGALFLAVLGSFSAVFAAGRRLGPAVEARPERRRRPGEFIDAFAGLCRRTHAGPQALSMILEEFRLFLLATCGDGSPAALDRASARAGIAPGRLAAALDRITRLSKARSVDDPTLLSCCRELEQLRESLRHLPLRRSNP